MKKPWNKNENADRSSSSDAAAQAKPAAEATPAADARPVSTAYTPKKGRPTPKRNEVERAQGVRRGPVDAPLTSKEARARKRELKQSMSKDELKAMKAKERAERREQRRIADERMASGDPQYLLDRDKGKERKLVRDWVDSRRFFANIFMPFAFLLLLIMLIGNSMPQVANIATLVAMVMIVALFAEGIWIGRKAMAVVRERYPNTDEKPMSLGFYAYSRASQPRRLRTPRPQVEIGGTY